MMIVRPSSARGRTKIDWLDSRHTFSFGDYYDPAAMGFGVLRVINEDRVAPGGGFPTHAHRDMEIVSYVVEGALEHKDSIGTGSVIRPGDVQRMTAGRGVRHSEFNASRTAPVHFLQIWIVPESAGLAPGYEQKAFAPAEREHRLRLIASRDGRDGSVTIHQDAALYGTLLVPGDEVRHAIARGRSAYVQVVRGELTMGGKALGAGDGAALRDEDEVTLTGGAAGAEALLFDLP